MWRAVVWASAPPCHSYSHSHSYSPRSRGVPAAQRRRGGRRGQGGGSALRGAGRASAGEGSIRSSTCGQGVHERHELAARCACSNERNDPTKIPTPNTEHQVHGAVHRPLTQQVCQLRFQAPEPLSQWQRAPEPRRPSRRPRLAVVATNAAAVAGCSARGSGPGAPAARRRQPARRQQAQRQGAAGGDNEGELVGGVTAWERARGQAMGRRTASGLTQACFRTASGLLQDCFKGPKARSLLTQASRVTEGHTAHDKRARVAFSICRVSNTHAHTNTHTPTLPSLCSLT